MGVARCVGQGHCKASVQGKKANSWESRSLCQLQQVAGRGRGRVLTEYAVRQTEMDKMAPFEVDAISYWSLISEYTVKAGKQSV